MMKYEILTDGTEIFKDSARHRFITSKIFVKVVVISWANPL